MLTILLVVGMLAANEPDIILTERPVPSAEGAEKFITCGRLEARLEYQNVWQRGVPVLEGRMSYSGHGESLASVLDDIKPQLNSIYKIDLECLKIDEIEARISGDLAGDKGYRRWVLTIDQKLDVAVRIEELSFNDLD